MMLRRRLRQESGMALVMAVGMMGVLAIVGGGVAYYSASNARSAAVSETQNTAYSLAEAGIAEALSKLNNALNPLTANLIQPTTVPMDGGSVTYQGTLNGYVWTITSTGTALNPTGSGAGEIERTLTRTAQVYGVNSGASVSAWSRMYHDSVGTCLTIEDVNITMPIASRGDICMRGSATVTGATTTVEAGDDITMTATATLNATSSPDGGATNGTGTVWSNPGYIVSNNGSRAQAVNIPGGSQSRNLDADFDNQFSIPSDAIIVGIRAQVDGQSNGSSVDDEDVYLLKNGAAVGSDEGSGSDWNVGSDSTRTYGGSSDLWGTTWTPADVNGLNFGLRLKVDNDSGSSRTASVDHVQITVYYRPAPPTSIGASGANVAKVHVGGTCTYHTQSAHSPCSSVDKVYADEIGTTPEALSKPAIDMAYWYANARPGPLNNCTTGSFPGGFDNDTTYNNSRGGSPEVTPESSSYTCQVKDAQGVLLGELSWNHVTHVLAIKGTIFVDGDFRFDDDGQIVHYQGRGIIYAAGDIEFDELVCAGGSGTTSCFDTGMDNWDPTTNMMIVLAGDDSEFDQGGTQDQEVPSGLQGIIYAKDDCTVHENFHLSGPIVCDAILLPSAGNGWPTYYPWPPLGTLVDGQVYADPTTAGDFLVVPGNQSG
jgi:Tfp pilus assembly protein PilX